MTHVLRLLMVNSKQPIAVWNQFIPAKKSRLLLKMKWRYSVMKFSSYKTRRLSSRMFIVKFTSHWKILKTKASSMKKHLKLHHSIRWPTTELAYRYNYY